MTLKSLKFGGTSMGSAESILECASIIKESLRKSQVIITVSAVSGVTEELIESIKLAKAQKPRLVIKKISLLELKHKAILTSLCSEEKDFVISWQENFQPLFEKLKAILHGTSLVGDISQKNQAQICAFGEKLSSVLMFEALKKKDVRAKPIESEKIIRTDSQYLDANVNLKTTFYACKKTLRPMLKSHIVPIVTGFIGKDTHGHTTLLGRGGSDYTASILALALSCDAIEIWTDVNGIMSADPRIIKDAISWPNLDIFTMSEIAYSGAKVVHPKTVTLAIEKNIPVYVLNTFNRKFKGTHISQHATQGIKGIVTTKKNILLSLENPYMLEAIGFISKVSNTVREHGVSIDVCATSETSFTFSIKEREYSKKLHKDLQSFADIKVTKNISKVSIIGQGVAQDSEVLKSIFSLCQKNKTKIKAVSIGASSRNITLMISDKNSDNLLKVLHKRLLYKE